MNHGTRFGIGFGTLALAIMLGLFGLAVPAAAQGTPPPVLPSLDALLGMALGAAGTLLLISLFGYYWGYIVAALAARVPFELPSWVWDALVLVPTAGVAGAWNAFALFINSVFPGIVDMTVGNALLWLMNWLATMFFARKGGLASVSELAHLPHSAITTDVNALLSRARKGVLLLG